MDSIRRIFVTGSRGFVGRRLVASLKERGISVIEADITCGVDISRRDFIKDMEAADAAVHLAGHLNIPFAFANPLDIYEPNIMGMLNVLDYCRQRGVSKIVYASSYVYGIPEYLPVDENHPTGIRNPYGRSKLVGETLCTGYYEDYGIVPVILRSFNIYGPGQSENFLIPTIVKQVVSADRITVKDLDPRRDYVYVDDVVAAFERAIFDYDAGRPAIFNVGYGKSYAVREIIDLCQRIAGTAKQITVETERRRNEILDCVADIGRIARELDWRPRIDIEEGLRQTVTYYRGYV